MSTAIDERLEQWRDQLIEERESLRAGLTKIDSLLTAMGESSSSTRMAESTTKPHRTHQMSAKNRKAARERMLAYWAKRRRASKGK